MQELILVMGVELEVKLVKLWRLVLVLLDVACLNDLQDPQHCSL